MSAIDDIFSQSRIDFGLKQKPNWNGTVYGSCQTKGCGNRGRVGFYEGGFCKRCSIRHPDDAKLPVLSGNEGSSGVKTAIPNPSIRWTQKAFVKDFSHNLSGSERADFYMTPEQLARKYDKVDFEDRFDPDDGMSVSNPPKKEKKKGDKEVWMV
jgi:hypothetical protein